MTAVVAVTALVLQALLVVTGASVLAETEVPTLPTRLGRLLDVGQEGAVPVAVTCLGVTALFLALVAVVVGLDRRLAAVPVREAAADPTTTPATAE